jgi:hypothetical protein
MTIQNYLIIENNVVVNTILWDGNEQTWQPQQGFLMLVESTTPTKIWQINEEKTEFVLIDSIGDADIGFTWDGTFAITNQPKPVVPTE